MTTDIKCDSGTGIESGGPHCRPFDFTADEMSITAAVCATPPHQFSLPAIEIPVQCKYTNDGSCRYRAAEVGALNVRPGGLWGTLRRSITPALLRRADAAHFTVCHSDIRWTVRNLPTTINSKVSDFHEIMQYL